MYCRDSIRKGDHESRQFDFLGYTFRARSVQNRREGNIFMSFTPAVSKTAQKAMRTKLRKLRIRCRADMNIYEISKWLNPIISGWINYYARYHKSAMKAVCRHINMALVKWARRKYKSLRDHKSRACQLMEKLSKQKPELFAHWKAGPGSEFA